MRSFALAMSVLTSVPPDGEIARRFALWREQMAETTREPPLTVSLAEAKVSPQRIGKFAAAQFECFGSTSQAMRAVRSGRFLINGDPCDHAALVRAGDNVTLLPPAPGAQQAGSSLDARAIAFATGLARHGTLSVIHEEDEMAIVCKPAGVHTKPFGAQLSLEAALPGLLEPPPRQAIAPLPSPVAVHRLDARVAGLVVVAKTRRAAAELAEAFRERRVRKRYRAMALGTVDPSLECIESDVEGRSAKTLVRVVQVTPHVQAGSLTTVDLWPVTGRRHQLRRHLAELGHPLLGDDLYFDALEEEEEKEEKEEEEEEEEESGETGAPVEPVGEGSGGLGNGPAQGRSAGSDVSFYGKKSAGLFLMSCEVTVPFDGRIVHAEVPEARKFERQRQRATLGYLHASQGQRGEMETRD